MGISRRIIKRLLSRAVPSSFYYSINAVVAARDIGKGKRWEPELHVVAQYVRPGDTVVDVGGNHGLYAYHLSKLVGHAGVVHTFEPMPPNLRILTYTIKRFRLTNVRVHPAACGDQAGNAIFCIPIERGVPQLGWARQGLAGKTFPCKVVRLDEVIDGKIAFLKCDVEGAELSVLRGGRTILERWRPVILLEAENHTLQFGYEQQDVFDFLGSIGYRAFNRNLEVRERFSEPGNYFFIHPQNESR